MARILVLGDLIIDQSVLCTATRLCPEAPVPVLVTEGCRITDGGAGLVYQQLRAFGHDVEALYGSKSVKTRYFAGGHLVMRHDADSQEIASDYLEEINKKVQEFRPDAVVISDYGKGAFTRSISSEIVQWNGLFRIFVDAKHNWEWYRGAFAIFPNAHEAKDIDYTAFGYVVRKLGEKGCAYFRLDGIGCPVPPAHAVPVKDVTGAGDIFMAAWVHKWLDRSPDKQGKAVEPHPNLSCEYANYAAGTSVGHVGTYVVQPHEMEGWRR